jgi:hypothetical protein
VLCEEFLGEQIQTSFHKIDVDDFHVAIVLVKQHGPKSAEIIIPPFQIREPAKVLGKIECCQLPYFAIPCFQTELQFK